MSSPVPPEQPSAPEAAPPAAAVRRLERFRALTADDLQLPPPLSRSADQQTSDTDGADDADLPTPPDRLLDTSLSDDDPHLVATRALLENFGGVILRGPPGTGKSHYAERIAAKLLDGDPTRVRFVQFHPSYQYEDFVEGFVPRRDGSGFTLTDKHLVLACKEAAALDDGQRYVLIIDELSRADPARVLGEALTYIEKSKRGLPFDLASGNSCVIPDNLVVIATMNVYDRGVDEVDAAVERRFGMIELGPSRTALVSMMADHSVPDPVQNAVLNFFDYLQGQEEHTPELAIGHAYFAPVRDEPSLRRLWNHQLRFVLKRAFPLEQRAQFADVEAAWDRATRSLDRSPLSELESASASLDRMNTAMQDAPNESPRVAENPTNP